MLLMECTISTLLDTAWIDYTGSKCEWIHINMKKKREIEKILNEANEIGK